MTRILPNTSRKPLASPLAMSDAPQDPAAPTPSPLPVRTKKEKPDEKSSGASDRPHPKPWLPRPKIRLEVRDLSHEGSVAFFKHANPTKIITDAITTVIQTLYLPFEGDVKTPPVRSITLVLRPMSGVAYTTGSDLDDEHKEIHFSLDYIGSREAHLQWSEIHGVLVHEMVHVWQWNGKGTCPGGLIEGIADYVRLKAGLSPPHWKREGGKDWDAGYERTAYFLEWLESKYGEGKVMEMNAWLRGKEYEEDKLWKATFNKTVAELWEEYNEHYKS